MSLLADFAVATLYCTWIGDWVVDSSEFGPGASGQRTCDLRDKV